MFRRANILLLPLTLILLTGTVAYGSTVPNPSRQAPGGAAVHFADALVQFPKQDRSGYLILELSVSHGVIGDDYPDQFEVLVQTCTAGGCTVEGVTRAALAPGAFAYSNDLARATLRTTWLGHPLRIDWRGNRNSTVFDFKSDTRMGAHKYEFVNSRTRQYVTSTATLMGWRRPCPGWSLSQLTEAEHAFATTLLDYPPGSPAADIASQPELNTRKPTCA